MSGPPQNLTHKTEGKISGYFKPLNFYCFFCRNVLVHSAYCKQNTIAWGVYKQSNFISHSSRGWQSKIKASAYSVHRWPLSSSSMAIFLLCTHSGLRGKGALWGLFYKGTNASQRLHVLIQSHWELGFNIGISRGHIQLNCILQNSCTEALPPNALECECIWTWSF